MTNYKEKFKNLISSKRIRDSSMQDRSFQEHILSDKARILTCSAFRRLQGKAQVFSLETNDSVRTRLTHSLEVAMNGELIAGKIFDRLVKGNQIDETLRIPFIGMVQNACLIHDIGNPPFGHFGEFAIQNWFKNKEPELEEIFKNENLGKSDYQPFLDSYSKFDGNAQGFRIVTRTQRRDDKFGLNLTMTLLASSMKYLDYKGGGEEGSFFKKPGFFYSEQKHVDEIRNGLNLEKNKRHPLAYIMEASDDISYCLSDIEDAIEKGIIKCEYFFDWVDSNYTQKSLIDKHKESIEKVNKLKTDNPKVRFIEYKILCTRYFIDKAAEFFLEDLDSFMDGETRSLFQNGSDAFGMLNTFKIFAIDQIFSSQETIDLELACHAILTGLLDKFFVLIKLSSEEFTKILHKKEKKFDYPLEKRLLAILPKQQLQVYEDSVTEHTELEILYRIQLIIDYVSGMTDSHAQKVFHILTGVKAEVR